MFLMNPRFLCTILLSMIQVMTQSFTYSTLQLNLNRFDNGEQYVLHAFAISSIVYGLFCVIFSNVLPKSVDQRYYIAIGTLVMILCLTMVGPITQFGIPIDIRLLFVGITIQYIFLGLAVFTILNELCLIGTSIDNQIDSSQITDMCSGLFVSAVSIGGLTGPIFAGILIQHCSFQTSFLVFFCFSMAIFIMYMTIGQGWQLLFPNKQVQQKSIEMVEMH